MWRLWCGNWKATSERGAAGVSKWWSLGDRMS
jgi:hypothetical protein